MPAREAPEALTELQPVSGLRGVDWRELWQYRDLFYFLVWRDVKTRYAQSVLGIGWAVIQPIFTMLIFTVIFGRLAKVESDGAPYAVFSLTALVPWTYFSSSLSASSGSLVSSSNLLTKVYFPRLILPVAPALSKLLDFAIAGAILAGMLAWYGISPNRGLLVLPFLVLVMLLTAIGFGMWLTALAVKYRDVKYAMSFGIQLLMYAAPVVYPASLIPQAYRWIYALNPMAGVIEGFRSALLGTQPMPWDLIGIGTLAALVIAGSGVVYFRSMEAAFADVV